ncbi:hypothetical protein BU16DRAFT_567076 [Lophium mytilinum]|uniref:Uncharacterized protein n=1 Tax=Lophium mytilinum TaxID=390894 RepID=A0A6A6QCW8_9PEZI|nr:hypothetical protein BU16DRAFT_567076 [Lophium mytilinum]
MIAGLLSLMPGLQELRLEVGPQADPVLLPQLAQLPTRPILKSLKFLDVEGGAAENYSVFHTGLFLPGLQHDASMLFLSSLQKLCIKNNGDDFPELIPIIAVHPSIFANIRAASNITDVTFYGEVDEDVFIPFLASFKQLRKLRCTVTGYDAPARAKLFRELEAHRDTLETLTLDWNTEYLSPCFVPFEKLTQLEFRACHGFLPFGTDNPENVTWKIDRNANGKILISSRSSILFLYFRITFRTFGTFNLWIKPMMRRKR